MSKDILIKYNFIFQYTLYKCNSNWYYILMNTKQNTHCISQTKSIIIIKVPFTNHTFLCYIVII